VEELSASIVTTREGQRHTTKLDNYYQYM